MACGTDTFPSSLAVDQPSLPAWAALASTPHRLAGGSWGRLSTALRGLPGTSYFCPLQSSGRLIPWCVTGFRDLDSCPACLSLPTRPRHHWLPSGLCLPPWEAVVPGLAMGSWGVHRAVPSRKDPAPAQVRLPSSLLPSFEHSGSILQSVLCGCCGRPTGHRP